MTAGRVVSLGLMALGGGTGLAGCGGSGLSTTKLTKPATAPQADVQAHGEAQQRAEATARQYLNALASQNAAGVCALMLPADQKSLATEPGSGGSCASDEQQIMKLGYAGDPATWRATKIVGVTTHGNTASVAVRGPVAGEMLLGTVSLQRAGASYKLAGDKTAPLPLTPPDKLPKPQPLFGAKDRAYLYNICGYLPFATASLCKTEYLKAAQDYFTGAGAKVVVKDLPGMFQACMSKTHESSYTCGRKIATNLQQALGSP